MPEGHSPPTTWQRVDEPVLRWVASLPPSLTTGEILDLSHRAETSPVEGLEPLEVDRSLRRLLDGGFISGNGDAMNLWWRLRLAPRGLVYLGEWPDIELVASAATLHRVLRTLAEDAPEDERDAVNRAAGVVARTVDGVLRDTLAEVAHGAGEELAG